MAVLNVGPSKSFSESTFFCIGFLCKKKTHTNSLQMLLFDPILFLYFHQNFVYLFYTEQHVFIVSKKSYKWYTNNTDLKAIVFVYLYESKNVCLTLSQPVAVLGVILSFERHTQLFFLFKTNEIFGFYHPTLSLCEDISNMAVVGGGGSVCLRQACLKLYAD